MKKILLFGLVFLALTLIASSMAITETTEQIEEDTCGGKYCTLWCEYGSVPGSCGCECLLAPTREKPTIETIQIEIMSMNLKGGTQNALLSILDNVQKSLDKENQDAAINQLRAFINMVEAQRGKKILERYAEILIKYAENIINQIETQLPPPTDKCQCSCSVSTSEPVTTERFVSLFYSYSMDCSDGDCRIAKAFVNAATSCSDGTSGGSYWEAPNLIAETSFFRGMQDVWCHQSIALTVICSDGAECVDVWSKLIFIPAYEGSAEN